jgi:hypothetical protein
VKFGVGLILVPQILKSSNLVLKAMFGWEDGKVEVWNIWRKDRKLTYQKKKRKDRKPEGMKRLLFSFMCFW